MHAGDQHDPGSLALGPPVHWFIVLLHIVTKAEHIHVQVLTIAFFLSIPLVSALAARSPLLSLLCLSRSLCRSLAVDAHATACAFTVELRVPSNDVSGFQQGFPDVKKTNSFWAQAHGRFIRGLRCFRKPWKPCSPPKQRPWGRDPADHHCYELRAAQPGSGKGSMIGLLGSSW